MPASRRTVPALPWPIHMGEPEGPGTPVSLMGKMPMLLMGKMPMLLMGGTPMPPRCKTRPATTFAARAPLRP